MGKRRQPSLHHLFTMFVVMAMAMMAITPSAVRAGTGRSFAEIMAEARRGSAVAQVELGSRYHDGKGVACNYHEALKWYRKAADQENPQAQYNLGLMYDRGQGVTQDFKVALFWYTQAALQGNPAAQQNLGVMYAQGQGAAKNLLYSYAWSALAAAQGQSAAARNRDNAARHLARPQLAQAEELAAKLAAKVGKPAATLPASPPSLSASGTTSPRRQAPRVKSSGSGFLITQDGYLMTCHHVICGGGRITVKVGQRQYEARMVRDDADNDLALLKINGHFQPVAFAEERSATLGQEVFTIGFPDPVLQGVSAKFTKGEISSLAGIRDDARLYQISVPVQPGNSGGPLLDMNGNVTGVIEAMLDAKTVFAVTGTLPQSVNYAIKGTLARSLASSLPAVAATLPPPAAGQPFDQVVARVSQGSVMVQVHE